MSLRIAAASVAVTAVVLVASWALALPLERAALLAPVLVVIAAAVAGLAVFWTRVGVESLRGTGHTRAIVGAAVALVALVVVLALLGVDVPRE